MEESGEVRRRGVEKGEGPGGVDHPAPPEGSGRREGGGGGAKGS